MSNIFYDPEKFGLRIFEHIEDYQASYSFDDFVIWERIEDGTLFYDTDSGCSCPSPFESASLETIQRITNLSDLEAQIEKYRAPYGEDSARCTVERKYEVLNKVKAHLKKKKAQR